MTFSSSKKVEAPAQVEMDESYNYGLAEMILIAHLTANKEMLKQIGANIASLKDVRDNNIYHLCYWVKLMNG